MRKALMKSKSCSLIKAALVFLIKIFRNANRVPAFVIDLCNEMGRLMMLLQVNGTGFLE